MARIFSLFVSAFASVVHHFLNDNKMVQPLSYPLGVSHDLGMFLCLRFQAVFLAFVVYKAVVSKPHGHKFNHN